ncbi:acyltransferase [Arthrobacter sp. zg-Y1219]|uniref:acyltransferase family protein n=1 Tax=Arthrobacter sp. zg-Y1219 TaxID=3049067 RepID=UPI0024C44328|nr:acyltransferase [Arthrobacter sp. zg-Y1219]MDK1360194.1 acyltransferase [Arthrobacter sp. zg-Y1219]
MNAKVEQVDNKQLKALTGLRIVAALWVVVHHLGGEIFTFIPHLLFAKPIVDRGGLGVDLFFILSGFILTYQYVGRFGNGTTLRNVAHFLKLRIARVYPVHFVTLNLAVGLYLAGQLFGVGMNDASVLRTFSAYIQNIFLVHAWLNQPYSWNGASWSVSAEWFAYLLFPFTIVIICRVRTITGLLLGVMLPAVTYVALGIWVLSPGMNDRPDHVLIRIAVGFTLGCFLARIFSKMQLQKVRHWLAPLAFAVVISMCYLEGLAGGFFLLPLGLLVLGLAIGSDVISRTLSLRPFIYGGQISYSLYMIHGLVLSVSRKIIPENAEFLPIGLRVLVLLGVIVAALLAAHFLFQWVEEPSRKYIRTAKLKKRSPVLD